MADENEKGWLGRIGDKLADRAIDWIANALPAGIGIAVLTWFGRQWACIKQPKCAVPGWLHGLLIGVAGVSVAAALWLGRWGLRTRRELRATKSALEAKAASPGGVKPAAEPFQRIAVEDHRLQLRWYIRRPPREWLEWRNINSTASPFIVQDVLDGPFHAVPGCNEALTEIRARASLAGPMPPKLVETCRVCGRRIFRTAQEGIGVAVWPVRVYALEELQRMHRNGTKLEGRDARAPAVVLENPAYWTMMLPPGN